MSFQHRLSCLFIVILLSITSWNVLPQATTAEPMPVAADAPAPLDDARLAELEAYIVEAMQAAQIPGAAVAVVQNGKVIFAKGFGVRQLGENEPLNADTLLLVGSSTKPLTTTMMATVVDDGLMEWNTPVSSVLPSFRTGDADLTGKLTMRHLVCACSGMPSIDAPLFLSDMRTGEGLIRSMGQIKPVTAFEKAFNYSNQMVAAGGFLAALAAGGPKGDLGEGYKIAMQKRVFDPIGMTHSTLSFEKAEASKNYALPHGLALSGSYEALDLMTESFVIPVMPAGGVWSTAPDMAQFLVTELNQGIAPNGKRVVSVENLTKTWEGQVKTGLWNSAYGLGWFVEDEHGLQMIHHGGNTMGFSSELAFLPTAGVGIVVLTNAEAAGSFTTAIRQRFFELAFNRPMQNDTYFKNGLVESNRGIAGYADMLLPQYDESAAAPYLGTFRNETLGEITLQAKDGALMLITGGLSGELQQLAGSKEPTFVLSDAPWAVLAMWTFQLDRDENGEPVVVMSEKNVTDPFIFKKSAR